MAPKVVRLLVRVMSVPSLKHYRTDSETKQYVVIGDTFLKDYIASIVIDLENQGYVNWSWLIIIVVITDEEQIKLLIIT